MEVEVEAADPPSMDVPKEQYLEWAEAVLWATEGE